MAQQISTMLKIFSWIFRRNAIATEADQADGEWNLASSARECFREATLESS